MICKKYIRPFQGSLTNGKCIEAIYDETIVKITLIERMFGEVIKKFPIDMDTINFLNSIRIGILGFNIAQVKPGKFHNFFVEKLRDGSNEFIRFSLGNSTIHQASHCIQTFDIDLINYFNHVQPFLKNM
jgi:hypothetical protein